MLFGNKDIFAIESSYYSSDSSSDDSEKYSFGCISAWIGGSQIGDPSLTVILETPVSYFMESIKNCGSRVSNSFFGMSYIEIWEFLNTALWGDDQDFIEKYSLLELTEFEKKYSKYSIFTNFSEAFDGETVFLIESDSSEKIIWQDFQSKEIKEHTITLGTYKRIVDAFLCWYSECCLVRSEQTTA